MDEDLVSRKSENGRLNERRGLAHAILSALNFLSPFGLKKDDHGRQEADNERKGGKE